MSYFEINKFGKHKNLEGTICYIGLGSNLEDPLSQIVCATKMIDLIPKTHLLASSSIYQSKPLGDMHQPDYLNAVLKVVTQQSAEELLVILEFIEAEQGRLYKENEERWAPRIIDLDILLFGDEIIDQENLIVPHNELHKRSFVLKPLEEIDEFLTIPTTKAPLPIQRLISRIDCNDLELVCKVTYKTVEEENASKKNSSKAPKTDPTTPSTTAQADAKESSAPPPVTKQKPQDSS